MKKLTITIGIPAYQSEKNIAGLVKSLVNQSQHNCVIEKILVYCDGCTDKTAENAKSVRSKKISVIEVNKNKGFAYGVNYMLRRSKSDIFVLLNDDIKIISSRLIDNLIKPFQTNTNLGLVNGVIIPLVPKGFIGRSVKTSADAYLAMALSYKNGKSRLTVDGKIMALSKSFARTLNLTSVPAANLDIYLYFENLRQKREYVCAKKARVYYRLPETIKDFRSQEKRNIQSLKIMRKHFGKIVDTEWKIPVQVYWKELLKVFIKHPFSALFFKVGMNAMYFLPESENFVIWTLAESTKHL